MMDCLQSVLYQSRVVPLLQHHYHWRSGRSVKAWKAGVVCHTMMDGMLLAIWWLMPSRGRVTIASYYVPTQSDRHVYPASESSCVVFIIWPIDIRQNKKTTWWIRDSVYQAFITFYRIHKPAGDDWAGEHVKCVKCYPGGRKMDLIPSISELQSQAWYHCIQYTTHHHMRLISHF